MFHKSTLEDENNLPYWYVVDIVILEQAIKSFQLHRQLNKDLNLSVDKNFSRAKLIKL